MSVPYYTVKQTGRHILALHLITLLSLKWREVRRAEIPHRFYFLSSRIYWNPDERGITDEKSTHSPAATAINIGSFRLHFLNWNRKCLRSTVRLSELIRLDWIPTFAEEFVEMHIYDLKMLDLFIQLQTNGRFIEAGKGFSLFSILSSISTILSLNFI